MTTQLLATELANLIQESKRKHNDLRQVWFLLRAINQVQKGSLGYIRH